MNQFSIDYSPVQSAKWLVNVHVSKMLLESCQCLCTNYHLQGIDAPYKPSHKNHPTPTWMRASYDNFLWALEHAYAIAAEYTERYHKRHKSEDVLDWVESNSWRLGFDSEALTPFALAISEDAICRTLPEWGVVDEVGKYRLFYKHDKKHLHQWKQNRPSWI
jgi:hypothetical protein